LSATGLATFDRTLEKTNGILKQIEQAYGWPKEPPQVLHALRAVLLALRDRLTVEEAVQLSAQLPMLVRGEWDDKRASLPTDVAELVGPVSTPRRETWTGDLPPPARSGIR
jgi:uncharacterized protein (DUF2267 family)